MTDLPMSDAKPPPHGLIFTLSEAVKMYGPVDVMRALAMILDAKLAQPGCPDKLVAALKPALATLKPAIEKAWREWPYKD